MIFENYFFMVKSTVVQPPLLARLATVSVLLRRAVNRQPSFRSGNSKGRSPLQLSVSRFFWKFWNFQKKLFIFQLFENVRDEYNSEILKSFSDFNTISINLNMCFTTILEFPSTFIAADIFRNYFFMVKSMATSGEPSTWLPLGKLEGQESIPVTFSRTFGIFKKSHYFSTLKKCPGLIELRNFKIIFAL